MKHKKKIVLSLFLLVLLASGCGKEGIAASVNGQNIPIEDYQKEYWMQRNYVVQKRGNLYLEENIAQGQDKTVDKALKEMVLKNLEQSEIIRQEAKNAGIEIKDEDVNQVLDNMKKQYGGEEAFLEALEKKGMTEDYLKKNIKNSILQEKLYKHIERSVKITNDEVEKYYEKHKKDFAEVNVDHILVKSKELAEKIKRDLDNGAEFRDMAKEYSVDFSSYDNGGSLGYLNKKKMPAEFIQKVFSMGKGEVSDPVKTQLGYHIIKVNDVKDSLEFMRSNLIHELKIEKTKKELEKIEKNAKIKEYVNFNEEVAFSKSDNDK